MLVYCNGAFKSGSTWLYHIAKKLVARGKKHPVEEIPEQYQNPHQSSSGIQHELLGKFLRDEDYTSKNYVVKAHLATLEGRGLLEGNPNVRVLTSERDIRDVAVSSYYHYLRLGKIEGTFAQYFWDSGQRTLRRVLRYHRIWDPASTSIHKTHYEALLENFDGEVKKLAQFIGVPLSEEKLDRIRETTSLTFSQQRERGNKGEQEEIYFFRKGTAGQWKDYLDDSMLKRIEEIKREVAAMPLTDDDKEI